MELSCTERGEVGILTVEGSIHAEDNEEYARAFEEFREGGRLRVVIDASALEYMNSRAVGTLVGFARDARLGGGKVVLVRPGQAITKILSAVGLLSLVPSYGTLDEALAACQPAPADG